MAQIKTKFFLKKKTYLKPMCLYIVRFYTTYMHIQYDMYRILYDIDMRKVIKKGIKPFFVLTFSHNSHFGP